MNVVQSSFIIIIYNRKRKLHMVWGVLPLFWGKPTKFSITAELYSISVSNSNKINSHFRHRFHENRIFCGVYFLLLKINFGTNFHEKIFNVLCRFLLSVFYSRKLLCLLEYTRTRHTQKVFLSCITFSIENGLYYIIIS